jgi:hypothetical protein
VRHFQAAKKAFNGQLSLVLTLTVAWCPTLFVAVRNRLSFPLSFFSYKMAPGDSIASLWPKAGVKLMDALCFAICHALSYECHKAWK